MIYCYQNGNVLVAIDSHDGTRHMFTKDNEFDFDYPVSLDVNLTQKCDGGCKFCYAGCTPDGKHAELSSLLMFLDTVPPYIEMALQVNDLSHPDLSLILKKLKERHIFANITVNQKHYMKRQLYIQNLYENGLINGIGVSLTNPTKEFIDSIKWSKDIVIHTIAGVTSPDHYKALSGEDVKVLILGFKHKGRGNDFYASHEAEIKRNTDWIKFNLRDMLKNWYSVLSFDNLALNQLDVKSQIPENEWSIFYQGDEGTCSMYIDLVNERFGMSSLVPVEQMHPITDNIYDMFSVVKNEAKTYG